MLGSRDLLERERELSALDDLITAVQAGTGSLLLLEGPPGVGKTSLTEAAAKRAAASGLTTLVATGAPLEQDLAWGVVRSALGPELSAPLAEQSVAAPEADLTGALMCNLFWGLSDLAERRPVVLIIDDAQWADLPSGRWLAYLAARVQELPLTMILAARRARAASWWSAIAAAPGARVFNLGPLTPAGTRTLVNASAPEATPEIADACHEATAGNPFLLTELLRQVAAGDGRMSEPAKIRALRPQSIQRSVLARLGHLGDDAAALCFAVAILGQEARLMLAGELAGLDRAQAETAAAALEEANLVHVSRQLEFIHPIVREVISDTIPAARVAGLHLRAAELLEARGAPPSTVAAHLLATEPAGRASVVAILRRAAADAAALGSPETAIAHLRRAVEEPPAAAELAEVMLELGHAEAMLGEPEAAGRLRRALEHTGEPVLRARITSELAGQLVMSGEIAEAVAICESAAAALPEGERELRLELFARARVAAGQDTTVTPAEPPGLSPSELSGSTRAERALLAATANVRTRTSIVPLSELSDLAARALRGTALLEDLTADSPQFWSAVCAIGFAEQFDEVATLIEAAERESRRRGSARGYGMCLCFGSPFLYRQGRLAQAADDARRAAEIFAGQGLVRAFALSFLLEALIDQGELAQARSAVATIDARSLPQVLAFTRLRASIARLELAERGAADATSELLAVVEMAGDVSPVFFPWLAEAAVALAEAGDAEQAVQMATEEVRRAEHIGSSWVLARALYALAVAGGSLEPLERAESLTRNGPLLLERARIVVALGAGLRRRGRTRDAQALLREGLDLSDRCGAAPLSTRAHQELLATGARPRRPRSSGPSALTPSELRICRMAAAGAGNREIARALFISLRTVETHLTHAYSKLGISGRDELQPESAWSTISRSSELSTGSSVTPRSIFPSR